MKTITLPSVCNQNEKIILKYENTPIALILYNTLYFEGDNKICNKIALFYAKLTEKFSVWVNNGFEKYAKKDYLSDTNPRKKFRYVPFELKYEMYSEIKNEFFLEVIIKITLSKRKNKISEKNIIHFWNLKNGSLHIQKKTKHKK